MPLDGEPVHRAAAGMSEAGFVGGAARTHDFRDMLLDLPNVPKRSRILQKGHGSDSSVQTTTAPSERVTEKVVSVGSPSSTDVAARSK